MTRVGGGIRGLAFAVFLIEGLALDPTLAMAQAASAAPPRIVVTYNPSSERQQQTLTAVQAHLRGLPVEVLVEPVRIGGDLADRLRGSGELASANEALGTFSIEEGADSSILVFLTEAGGEATLVRRLPPSAQSRRLATEQAAIVVRSLVESLLEGGRIAVARATGSSDVPESSPAEEVAVPPESAAPATERTSRLFLVAGYVGSFPGAGFPWQSGAAVGLHWFTIPTVYVGARYTFIPGTERNTGSVELSISHRPVEVVLGYVARSRMAPAAELAFIAEQSTRETTSTDAGLEPTPEKTHWSFAVGPRVGATFVPWPAVAASLRVGADFVLNRPSYATDEEPVLEPAAVRPRLDLELGLGVW